MNPDVSVNKFEIALWVCLESIALESLHVFMFFALLGRFGNSLMHLLKFMLVMGLNIETE